MEEGGDAAVRDSVDKADAPVLGERRSAEVAETGNPPGKIDKLFKMILKPRVVVL